jgi:FixJ family two-component response regulator
MLGAQSMLIRRETTQVAIVDDDASVRKALVRLFEAAEYSARAYGSAAEFLEALDQRIPECLVVDFHMPNMNGLELLRHLSRTGNSIPTIVITAYDEAEVRDNCIAAGASAYFAKPVRQNVLIEAVEKIVGI